MNLHYDVPRILFYLIVVKFDGFSKWRCDVPYGTAHLYLPSIDET